MSNDRKEPTFSGAPSSSDDDTTRLSPVTGNVPATGVHSTRSPASTLAPAPVVAKSSPLLPLALLMALTGLGLAGFVYWQLQMSQQQVAAAEKRIATLEDRLSLSDDESTQSLTSLQANLKQTKDNLELAHSEIRKLWDTRNVNKRGIEENDKALSSLAKSVKSTASAASAAQKAAADQLQNWKTLSAEVSAMTEQMRVVSDLAESQQRRIRELVDINNRLESDFKQLKNGVASRVQANEEAIESI